MAIEFSSSYSYDENAKPGEFEPIPAGTYTAQIIEAEKQKISMYNDYGECLVLNWQIMEGDYEGRLIWQRLNLWGRNMNNNDKVISIANSQFAAVREATGKLTPRDTDELLYIPCLIKVAITQDKKKEYDPRNEIKGVKAGSGGAGGAKGGGGKNPAPTGSTPWGSSGDDNASAAARTAFDDNVPF